MKSKFLKMPGYMKNPFGFLLAISPLLFVIGVILHNLISGFFGIEEPVFFLLAVIGAPICFVVGLLGVVGKLVWSHFKK
jgi:hypothetical protein